VLDYPDSESDLEEVVLKLQEEPFEVENGVVTAALFTNVLFNLAYSPASLIYIPRLIESAKSDDFGFFNKISAGVGGGIAFGMHLAVQCSEEMPFHSEETFETYDAMVPTAFREELSGANYLDFCKWFQVDAADEIENRAVTSDVKTLVVAGEFDPITPPAFAELVAADLGSSADLVVIENESHGAGVVGCGAEVVRNFLDAPGDSLQNGCLKSLPELTFAGEPDIQSRRFAEAQLHFITEDPTPEELSQSLEDLRRRLNHR
jgi:pimeloyl-ACP methyl ester carboxylesterase